MTCPYFSFVQTAAGALAPVAAWRVVFVPAKEDSFLLPPNVPAELDAPAFVTTVRNFREA